RPVQPDYRTYKELSASHSTFTFFIRSPNCEYFQRDSKRYCYKFWLGPGESFILGCESLRCDQQLPERPQCWSLLHPIRRIQPCGSRYLQQLNYCKRRHDG